MRRRGPLRVALGVAACATVVTIPAAASARVPRRTTGESGEAQASTTAPEGTSRGAGLPSDPACSAARLSRAQGYVSSELAARVLTLNSLVSEVGSASHLSASDRSALLQELNGVELPGIMALQAQARAAGSCAQLRSIAHQMVFGYRVYLVTSPQVSLTVSASHETYTESQMAGLETKIGQEISRARRQGKNVAAAQSLLGDFEAHLAAARSDTAGLAATLVQQSPSGYPASSQVFAHATTAEATARNDLRRDGNDADQISRLIA